MISKWCPLMKSKCVEKDCALWTKHYNGCVIVEISDSLHSMQSALTEINYRQEDAVKGPWKPEQEDNNANKTE